MITKSIIITIIKQVFKINSNLTRKTKNYVGVFLFIVRLELISHLVLVYLLLARACSVAQVLSSFTSSWKQSVILTYISLINIHFKFYVQRNYCMKKQIISLGNVRIITKQCHVKVNISKLNVSLKHGDIMLK